MLTIIDKSNYNIIIHNILNVAYKCVYVNYIYVRCDQIKVSATI